MPRVYAWPTPGNLAARMLSNEAAVRARSVHTGKEFKALTFVWGLWRGACGLRVR